MITIYLIRHAERALDKEDQSSSLTKKGKEDCIVLKSFFNKIGIKPKLFLFSSHHHAKETAEELRSDLALKLCALEALTPDNIKWTVEDVLDECNEKKIIYTDYEEIAVIGHEGRLSRLLTQLTGERFRPFDRLDIVAVKAQDWNELRVGKGTLLFRYPVTNFQEEKLQSKVQSKMTVATFLAGFNFAILSTFVTSENLSNNWVGIAGFICMILSLFLFISSIYIYDSLSMPPGFWLDQDRPRRIQEIFDTPAFRKTLEKNGPLYAYMIRTWNIFFTPAVLLSLLGFIFLLLSGDDLKKYWLLGSIILAFILVYIYYYLTRPNLSCD